MAIVKRKKKSVEYHFIDMNDPDRYKKLKVSRACDFCRRRKAKCDLGVPGTGTCSNCQKAGQTCVFSSLLSPLTVTHDLGPQNSISFLDGCNISPSFFNRLTVDTPWLFSWICNRFPVLTISSVLPRQEDTLSTQSPNVTQDILSLHSLIKRTPHIQALLFKVYYCHIHPLYPVLGDPHVDDTPANPPPSPLICFAVMAVSARFCTELPETLLHYASAEQVGHVFYECAQHMLEQQNVDIDNITRLQALLLLYKYTEMTQPHSYLSVEYLLRARAIAYQLHQVSPAEEVDWARKLITLSLSLSPFLTAHYPLDNTLDLFSQCHDKHNCRDASICNNLNCLYRLAIPFSQLISGYTNLSLVTSHDILQNLAIATTMISPCSNTPAFFPIYLSIIGNLTRLLLAEKESYNVNSRDMTKTITQIYRHVQALALDQKHQPMLIAIQGQSLACLALKLSIRACLYAYIEEQFGQPSGVPWIEYIVQCLQLWKQISPETCGLDMTEDFINHGGLDNILQQAASHPYAYLDHASTHGQNSQGVSSTGQCHEYAHDSQYWFFR